ncbi:FHA domain protein [Planctopirus ephydatiae]|uniref:FHA domain protein n=1 Tax=Planctopirus ephydatiae TaxID=2528019 RepID=A0A518GN85_9PLAN|nr:FHA domain-containing protein [Planctopirus ephydatiae]QDV30047.1 FHA domain protein [Planctopirus ephydatiae]
MSLVNEIAVKIHLVDPGDGRTLQTWSFESPRITIGRDPQQDVSLSDPYVSRTHAELVRAGSVWQLFSRGRNGILVNGKSITEIRLEPGMTFRLGANGPQFRFDQAQEVTAQATLSFDPESIIVLSFDRESVKDEAENVAATDYFQKLNQKAKELRARRQGKQASSGSS